MTIILMAAASSNGSNSDDDFDDHDEEMVRNEDKNAGFEIQMNQGGNVATKPEISHEAPGTFDDWNGGNLIFVLSFLCM